ncbi:hypothetical protein [Alicyclobacillus sendaiensis]|uniref:hypothetical protein n=1 Tax=Alicyclobacillus sendaiensis TaxID=192387 RepID=UPI0026F41C03|nr:hypothetical protein [Alicyclobacillus sendaiensis]
MRPYAVAEDRYSSSHTAITNQLGGRSEPDDDEIARAGHEDIDGAFGVIGGGAHHDFG